MATSGLITTAFTQEAGFRTTSVVARMLRVLRAANMAAMGVPGRGKSEGNATAYHYACLLLGFAGDQPSDAADAAATALPFEWQRSEPYSKTPRILGNLQKVLESIITGTWETTEKLEETTFCAPSLLILLNLASVQIMWPDAKGYLALTEYYGPAPGLEHEYKFPGVRKQTVVMDRMLLLAASLWRDNKPLAIASAQTVHPTSREAKDHG